MTIQAFLVFGLLTGTCVGTLSVAAELRKRLSALERRNERQTEMLIALLQRNGIDPVTLD